MSYAEAGGDRIHYTEQGSGEPVLLIHGAFGSGVNFLANPFGSVMAERYRVIAPDSLAHGLSDAPADPSHYSARARAGHLAAVLDAAGVERAHVVGYSMGGWMAAALAAFHPERVASLAVGGWDLVDGMYTPAGVWGLPKITGPILIEMVRRDRPDLVEWVGHENEAALAAAIEGMNDLSGLAEAVARCPAPVTIWIGEDDLYHAACIRLAEAHGIALIDLPGDHMSALETHGADAARRVSDFIQKSIGGSHGRTQ